VSVWYDKYVQQLKDDLETGEITEKEFEAEMLELDYDLQQFVLENVKRGTKGELSYEN